MNYPHFVRIDQETTAEGPQYFVVHTRDPKMAVKFSAEVRNGQIKPGTIQRVSVPNSWAGRYSDYAKLLAKAEAFFRASIDPVESSGGRVSDASLEA
jgi:hypothetical protein